MGTVDNVGFVEHINTKQAFGGKKQKARDNRKAVVTAINNEIDRLEKIDNPEDLEQSVSGQVDDLERVRDELKKPKGNIAEDYNKAVDTLEDAKMMAYQIEATLNAASGASKGHSASDASGPDKCDPPSGMSDLDSSDGPSGTGDASDSSGPSSTPSSGDGGGGMGEMKVPHLDMSLNEAVDMMSSNPQKLNEKMKELGPSERMEVMNMIQQQMDQIQQMFQTMSSIMSKSHKASMGIIRNI